ncbi:uncharacterized protein BT62DRAFT_955402, partial [Guyanagaster necrorhizus]
MIDPSDNVLPTIEYSRGLAGFPSAASSKSYEMSLPGHSECRPFLDSSSHGSSSQALFMDRILRIRKEIQILERRISSLKESEIKIAEEYGMHSDEIDSPAILQKAKERVLALEGASMETKNKAVKTAVVLDTLYKLRCSLSELQRVTIVPSLRVSHRAQENYEFPSGIEASRFWVVIIGIDAYRQLPLRGCVFDAITMEKYFIDLGVPKCRIQLLLGRLDGSRHDSLFPSRENIIKALHDIRTNPLIEIGDSIIIYFSGHGSHYFCSNYFEDKVGGSAHLGSVEAICPVDRDELDTDGHPISDISDRELNTIISLIRDTKGDNITLILDCCHSGSATR